jgi:hypothetical protein
LSLQTRAVLRISRAYSSGLPLDAERSPLTRRQGGRRFVPREDSSERGALRNRSNESGALRNRSNLHRARNQDFARPHPPPPGVSIDTTSPA